MPFGPGYSTTTKRVFLCLFVLIKVTTQQLLEDITYLSGPSGEFTSPGYPNTQPGIVGWNITVDEGHRILLQFLDFELVERNPCSLDDFELYDYAFVLTMRRGRWCWDSFDKLNRTTYISSGNIFFLRLRTIQGYSRKGFKANYSRISKEAKTTNTVNVKQTAAPNEVLLTHTTSTRNAPRTSFTTNVLNKPLKTALEEKLPPSTESSNQDGIIVAIATSIIVAIIVIFIAALIVWKYKMNNLSKESSNDEASKALSRGNVSTEMYEVVEKEDVHDIKTKYENTNLEEREKKSSSATDISMNVPELGVYSKKIVREGDLDTPDGTYETPDVKLYTYADPNEMKFCGTR